MNIYLITFLLITCSYTINGFTIEHHDEITKSAIYRVAAQVLNIDPAKKYPTALDLFHAAFGKPPTLPISELFAPPPADKRTPSTKPFEIFTLEVTSNYYELELLKETNVNFFWDETDVTGSVDLLKNILKDITNLIKKNKFDSLKAAVARAIFFIQNFYARTNWVEIGNILPADFLVDLKVTPAKVKGLGVLGDNENDKESEDHPLHDVAKNLAEEATIYFFIWLKTAINDLQKFKIFMGIKSGKGIAFNIDDTGSMGPYIVASREHAKAIADAYSTSANPPSRYVVQTFNDPTVGETLITTDVEVAKTTLGKITAKGGGDEPELCLTGLSKILDHLEDKSYSEIFVYTDAPAKDLDKLEEVRDKIQTKLPRITFLLAYIDLYPPYELLAAESAGEVVKVNSISIAETAPLLISKANVISEPVLSFENFTASKTTTFSVDSSTSSVTIQLTNLKIAAEVTIYTPTGIIKVPTVVTSSDFLRILKIDSPALGTWKVTVDPKAQITPYNLKISFETSSSLYVKIVNGINDVLFGGSEVDGSLLIDSTIGAVVDMVGVFGSKFPILDKVEIVKRTGEVIAAPRITQFKNKPRFLVQDMSVPTEPFKFKFYGKTRDGKIYERLDNTVYKVADTKLNARLYSIRRNVYTISYEYKNNRKTDVSIMLKVEANTNFKMNSYYQQIIFDVKKKSQYEDIIVLESLANPEQILGLIKINIYDNKTKVLIGSKFVNMDDLPESIL